MADDVFIDGTAASSKRAFTNALLSIASMYSQKKSVLSEMKAVTLAIAYRAAQGRRWRFAKDHAYQEACRWTRRDPDHLPGFKD
eukprot:481385-Pleurochrysis_carterae.AAC.1